MHRREDAPSPGVPLHSHPAFLTLQLLMHDLYSFALIVPVFLVAFKIVPAILPTLAQSGELGEAGAPVAITPGLTLMQTGQPITCTIGRDMKNEQRKGSTMALMNSIRCCQHDEQVASIMVQHEA
jgi:hypothetical protein